MLLSVHPNVPVDSELSAFDGVAIVFEGGILSIQALLKLYKSKPIENVRVKRMRAQFLPFVAAGETIDRDVHLAKASKAFKKSSDVSVVKAIGNVPDEQGSAPGAFLVSSTVNGGRRATALLIPTTSTTNVASRRGARTVPATTISTVVMGRGRRTRPVAVSTTILMRGRGRPRAVPTGRRRGMIPSRWGRGRPHHPSIITWHLD